MPAAPRRPRRLARWLLLCGSLGFTLTLVEIGFRIAARIGDEKLRVAFENLDRPRLPRTGEVDLAHLSRRSKNPRILYELVPNITGVTYKNVDVSTDRHGFRGPDRPAEKPAGGLRIVGIGDSVMFGWGVPEPETVLRRLETRLRAEFPGRHVDVINTAVPGYNTAMEVEVLVEKGLRFRPDLVIVDFCGNDTDLPNLLPRQRDYYTLRHSFLYDFVQLTLQGRQDPWRQGQFDTAPMSADGERLEHDPELVPKEHAWMVGWAGWRAAMERLVALSREHGFLLLATSHYDAPRQVRQGCQELGVPLFCAAARLNGWLKQHGLSPKDYPTSALTLAPNDPHPTALSCGLQFEALWEFLQQSGLLRELAQKR